MSGIDLSLELINMVIIAAGVVLLLSNMATGPLRGFLLILIEQTRHCDDALCG